MSLHPFQLQEFLSAHLPISQLIYPSIRPPTYTFVHPPTHPFFYPPIHSSFHPPIHPSTHLSILLPIHPSTYLSTCLPTHPSIHPFSHLLAGEAIVMDNSEIHPSGWRIHSPCMSYCQSVIGDAIVLKNSDLMTLLAILARKINKHEIQPSKKHKS